MLTSGTLPITTDADLDAPGFGTYVNFSGGTLQINGNWSTSRVISVLPGGGTIDTNGWPLTLPSTINDGVLTKSGTGLLTITTPGHTGGTTITAGGLLVGGGTTHSAPITVQGGALHGSGTAGSITVSGGAIQPGTPGVGNTAILQATEVTFSPGGSFVVDITGATAGSDYDQLAVSGVSTLGAGVATLTVNLLYAPISGTSFTILTNATGQFQGLPEGGTFLLGAENFRITYQGGDGNDVVLTADDVPSASAIGPQTIVESRVLGPLSLTVGDDLTPAGSLVVTGSSSNTAVVEDDDIVISGSGTVSRHHGDASRTGQRPDDDYPERLGRLQHHPGDVPAHRDAGRRPDDHGAGQ